MGCYNQYKARGCSYTECKINVSTCYTLWHFGDWSLIMGRGATKRQVGGQVKFDPNKKWGGGGGKGFSLAKGGGAQTVLR